MEAESGICDGREHLLIKGRKTLVQKDLHSGPEAQNSTAYFMYSLSRDSNEDGSCHGFFRKKGFYVNCES